MTKAQGSFDDEPGKGVESLAGKSGGELDKDELAPDTAEAGYDSSEDGSYESDYSDTGYDGGSSGDSSDGYAGSSDNGSDSSDAGTGTDGDSGGNGSDSDTGGDGDSGGGDDSGGDDSLYAEGESDSDTDGDYDIGSPDEGELDHDHNNDGTGTGTEQVTPEVPKHTVSIDVEGMTLLVAAMERAGERVGELKGELRSILRGVQLDTSDTDRFDEVAAWIEEQLPGLRRRLALARNLDDSSSTPQPDTPEVRLPIVEIDDESLIPDCPPSEAYQNGRDAAERFSVPKEQKPATHLMVADLRTGQHDPYFAKEFVHNTDPNDVVRVVHHATSADDGNSANSDELIQMTASTVNTGSHGTGDLSPPEGYEEQWAALRNSDDPETAALAARLRPAPQS